MLLALPLVATRTTLPTNPDSKVMVGLYVCIYRDVILQCMRDSISPCCLYSKQRFSIDESLILLLYILLLCILILATSTVV